MGYLALLSLGLGVLRFIAWGVNAVWGKEARLEAAMKSLAEKRAAARLAREQLKGRTTEIDQAPAKTGDDLVKGLNDAFRKKP